MNWMPALRAGRPVPAGLSCQLSAQVRPAKEGRRTGLDRVAAAFSVVAREELDVDLAVVLVVKKRTRGCVRVAPLTVSAPGLERAGQSPDPRHAPDARDGARLCPRRHLAVEDSLLGRRDLGALHLA